MKKLSALLTIFALFTSQTFAWVGGPYGNNTSDGNSSGIFQYTVRGTNVSGMSRFSQNVNAAYNSQFGDSVIYYNGVTYYGESYGFVDFDGGTCDGVINVNAAGADLTNPAAVLTSSHGTSFGVFNGVRYGLGNPLIGGVYSPGGPEATHMTGNGTWTGEITRKYPVPRFSGAGIMTFFGEGESSEAGFDRVSVATGELIVAPGTLLGRDPFNFTQRDYITVPTDAFKGKTTVQIAVYGGRISTFPYLGPAAFQAL